MEVKIETTTENKLLERKEIDAYVNFDGATPPRSEIKSAICGKVGANPDLVVLRSVDNEFGRKRVKVSAHVYEDEAVMSRNEPEYIRKREGFGQEKKEEPKAEEAPAATEEKKEEAPAEEKKKEAKPETEKPAEEKKEAKPETGDTKPETPKEG
jgi:small subunit ribosomal protein S24e